MAVEDSSNNQYSEGKNPRQLLKIEGDSAKFEGKMDISESIEVDCELNGELKVDGQINIRENGIVNADIDTIDASVEGEYDGKMKASGKVEIMESGIVRGSIKTDSLIINEGGAFDGKVSRITKIKKSK